MANNPLSESAINNLTATFRKGVVENLETRTLLEYAAESNWDVPAELRPHLAKVAKEEIARREQAEVFFGAHFSVENVSNIR